MKNHKTLSIHIDEICESLHSNVPALHPMGVLTPMDVFPEQKKGAAGQTILTIAKFCEKADITITELFDQKYLKYLCVNHE